MKKQIRQYFPLALLAFLVYLAVHYWAGIEKLAGVFFSAVTPLLAGCFIAYAVNILMSWFERQYSRLFRSERALRFRRGICILLAFLTLLAIITAAMGIMIPRLTGSLGHIVTRLGILLEQLAAFLDGSSATRSAGTYIRDNVLPLLTVHPEQVAEKVGKFLTNGSSGLNQGLIRAAKQALSLLGTLGVGLFFAIYILAGKERLAAQISRLLRAWFPRFSEKLFRILGIFNESYHNFIVGQVKDACVLGIMCCAGMLILRMPNAVTIALIIALTALVPMVGALVGAAAGAVLIFADSPMKALIFLIFFVIIQQVDNNVTYPRIVGSSIGLPGIWVLAAVTIGGGVFGVLGMLFFVPFFSAVYQIVKSDVKRRETAAGPAVRPLPQNTQNTSPNNRQEK